MSVKLTYTLDGREVTQKQFFDGLEGQVRRLAVDSILARVQEITCPEHGEVVTVSEFSETDKGFKFELSGCCRAAITRAEDRL
jgi:hypothetical protein